MLALVILLGVVVLTLLIIWLTNQIFLKQAAVPVEMMELGEGDGPLGGDMKLEGPADEEVELDEPVLAETLAAIADAVAVNTAMLDDPSLGKKRGAGRGGGGRGLGRGSGSGSGMARRWEVHFIEGNTLETYAKQLDSLGIELGVLLPDNQVLYVSKLSRASPQKRVGPASEEKRYYLTWRSGELQQADHELLSRAGVRSKGRIIVKFLPPHVEAQLAQLEKTHAGPDADKVRKTRFGIRKDGSGYSFFVIDQSYRY